MCSSVGMNLVGCCFFLHFLPWRSPVDPGINPQLGPSWGPSSLRHRLLAPVWIQPCRDPFLGGPKSEKRPCWETITETMTFEKLERTGKKVIYGDIWWYMVIYGDTVETLSSNNGDNQPSHKERLPNSVQVQLFKIMISPQGLICTSAGQPQLPYLKKLLALQSIGTRGLTAGLMMSSVSHIYIYIYIFPRYIPHI